MLLAAQLESDKALLSKTGRDGKLASFLRQEKLARQTVKKLD